jgi:hypothetical protein
MSKGLAVALSTSGALGSTPFLTEKGSRQEPLAVGRKRQLPNPIVRTRAKTRDPRGMPARAVA